jgi:hypothetical protein
VAVLRHQLRNGPAQRGALLGVGDDDRVAHACS